MHRVCLAKHFFHNTNMGTSTIASRHNHIHISTVEHLQAYRMNYNGVTMIVQDANTVTYVTPVRN